MTLLRPHVAEIYAGAVRRRRGVLTPREWEVLDLAAEGHSNAEIAAILFTSVSTVRKHMENIFDRIGVRTRGAAVARMLPKPAIYHVGAVDRRPVSRPVADGQARARDVDPDRDRL